MTAVHTASSPVRTLGRRLDTGCVLLTDVKSSYLDGAEAALVAKFDAVSDRSSTSDELAELARGWAETYHLSTARANVVRCFDLPPGAKVLEIGAGCGAITRHLGEAGCIVDALEPVPARATVARARTKDLRNVEVFIGTIDDVPETPTYDVIAIIGVLEYVGNGTRDPEPYAEFLRGVYARLRPGGVLLLAIENKLGVKYLAGSPEDHSGRIYDSVEGYPQGNTPARTFSRRELQEMLHVAGLESRSFVAFPDYKMTRTVMSVDVPDELTSLLYRVPTFPSPDRGRARPRAIDERSLWQSAVEAGLAGDLGNSLVLLAGKPAEDEDSAVRLWPQDRLATFFSDGRPARLTMRTDVVETAESAVFVRTPLVAAADVDPAVLADVPTATFVPGLDGLDAIRHRDDDGIAKLLASWIQLVRDTHRRQGGRLQMDLVPHNLIVEPSGRLVVIDEEWTAVDVDPDTVIRRGLFWTAQRLSELVPYSRWPHLGTVADLAVHFGQLAGFAESGDWLETFFAAESRWQASVHEPVRARRADEYARRDAAAVNAAASERNLRAAAAVNLRNTSVGMRTHEFVDIAISERNKALTALRERDSATAAMQSVGAHDLGELLTVATNQINALTAERNQLAARVRELEAVTVV